MDPEDAALAEEWLHGLVGRDPLRPCVRALLDDEPVPENALDLAVQRLASPDRYGWRSVALSALLVGHISLNEDARRLAVPLLQRLACRQAHRRGASGLGPGCAWGCATTALCWGAALAAGVLLDAWRWGEPVVGVLFSLLWLTGLAAAFVAPVMGVVRDRSAACPFQCAALRTLGRLRDVASLGTMVEACLDYREEKHRAGEAALLQVLDALSPERYGTVTGGTIAALCTALRAYSGTSRLVGLAWFPGPAVARAILEVLERVGGGSAVDAVREVAEESPNPGLQARAHEALPVLLARRAQERDAARLLRPADAPQEATLLRPASAAQETPPEQLLRPADEGEPDGRV